MPIDYKEYHPKWSLISRLVRFYRAKNKCEFCQVPNHSYVVRDKHGRWRYRLTRHFIDSLILELWRPSEIAREYDCTYIVLTVAHLDQDKTNNRFNNLAALCQRCHLKHDQKHNISNRKYGRNHKQNNFKLEL